MPLFGSLQTSASGLDVYKTWLDATAACQFLETEVPKNTEYGWGDVFVRVQSR